MGTLEQHALEQREHLHAGVSPTDGSKRLIIGFFFIILLGASLLKLPFATINQEGISWVDAIFTATSAVTVTGLVLTSTAETFTIFGQIVILLLIQIGGVGFISLSLVLFRLAGRQVKLGDRFLLQQSMGVDSTTGILRLAMYVLGIVLGIEMLGALLLAVRWAWGGMVWYDAIYNGIFHSISAFCNAGFDLFYGTEHGILFGFQRDIWSLGILAGLIMIGGWGIPVVDELLRWRRGHRLTLHSKIILTVTLILNVGGTIVIMLDTWLTPNYLHDFPLYDQVLMGTFTVISARTAGVTIIPLEQMGNATQLVIMVLMFIGGAPSSMAGGVSISTFAALALAMRATVKGEYQVRVFGRAIPNETVYKAIAVMTVSTLLVFTITLIMTMLGDGRLFVIGFEVISGFSNTGYSLNYTTELDTLGKLLIAFVMFWGRLGPLTIVVTLAQRQHVSYLTYPEEKIIMG
jgi:trk system potassium uptake protein TrkH